MPVEIKELVIKATITDAAQPGVTEQGGNNTISNISKEQIIEACVQQVLDIIERKKDR